jgi:hypothetical protein
VPVLRLVRMPVSMPVRVVMVVQRFGVMRHTSSIPY